MTRTTLPTGDQPYALLEAEGGEQLSSLSASALDPLYRRHGALLLRGFAGGLEEFGTLARSLCPVAVQNDSRGRSALAPDQGIQSVNLGTRPFPLHPELSREPWKPDSCFFYCVEAPGHGGRTTICDGVAIVRDLPPAIRDAMAGRRLKYVMPAPPPLLDYWLGTPSPDDSALANPPASCPYRFERAAGGIVRIFTRPLLHQPMFASAPAFGNFLLFARYMAGVKTFPLLDDGTPVPDDWVEAVKHSADRLTVPVPWRRGDLLILDNTRFMHGRTEVTDSANRLIATYFGYRPGAPVNPEEPPNPAWRQPGFCPPGLAAGQ